MGLELEGVGRLVEGDPGAERIEGHAERPGGLADVLLDEEELPGLGFRGQEGEVVLAQDALAHEAQEEPELAGRDPAVRQGQRGLPEPGSRRHDLVEELALQPPEERGEGGEVGPDPGGPVHDRDALDDARERRLRGPPPGRARRAAWRPRRRDRPPRPPPARGAPPRCAGGPRRAAPRRSSPRARSVPRPRRGDRGPSRPRPAPPPRGSRPARWWQTTDGPPGDGPLTGPPPRGRSPRRPGRRRRTSGPRSARRRPRRPWS